MQVHELFVEHLKKSKVNVIGAFILANDVNRLQARCSCAAVGVQRTHNSAACRHRSLLYLSKLLLCCCASV